ncbi:OsmC family protein [Microbulbifer salipaludis]|uniref:OsmC family protein n=1 Tax=Microbulbifer salipaludis TaxID=187980 RepID=A0ABS3E8U8_9GAMM|nr:OsmC family protein [Microbulbifer salipaludis]MBN8431727.1 OsmC family protein [Microbulbifer salipaludis]
MTEKTNYHVGEFSNQQPLITQYQPSKFAKAKHPEPYRFEVNLSAEAGKKQRKQGVVSVNIPGFSPVKLYCDEQPPVGDDTAPPPLAFFAAGIGFCLMTHLTDILTARKIQVDNLKLEQRIVFRTNLGHMREHGYMTNGGCDVVETHVIIDSPESEHKIKDLLDEAENGCMAHYALRNPIPWSTRLIYNGNEVISRQGA